jgi:uncharacterized protein YfbU (UPF0304 family)
MQAKTERFEMRLGQDTLDRVDWWRSRQDDLPSRAEAVRRLIESGLGLARSGAPRFRDGEKLILSMLCDVSRHLKIKDGADPDFVASALYGGHNWALKWELQGIFHGHEDSERAVSEAVDILDMWSFIESAYAKLSKKDQERIRVEAEPFGKHVTFPGFDGNNETEHLGIARFLIEKMGRFTIFKGRELNSHAPLLGAYRRMVAAFDPMRPGLVGRELNADEIIKLLKAKMHPDHRERSDEKAN